MLTANEAQDVLKTAQLVCPAAAAAQAVARMAAEITAALATAHPLVLSVMTGAVVVTGQLLPLRQGLDQ